MKVQRIVLLTVGILFAARVAVANHEPAAMTADTAPSTEVQRIQAHLQRVESELLQTDVSQLTDRQRANRMQHIAVLRRYREQGVFPHNHVADRHTPVFIDEHGTHCAVGYLLAQSGHEALARRVAAERNLARVPELSDLPELVAWLDDAGLSVAEAARIQPFYGPFPNTEFREQTRYPTATAVAAGVGGATIAWNLLADREGSAWWLPGAVGVGVGVAESTIVLWGLSDKETTNDISDELIGVNAAIGLLSGILGARTFLLGRADTQSTGNDRDIDAGSGAMLTVSPWTARRGTAGVRLALRF